MKRSENRYFKNLEVLTPYLTPNMLDFFSEPLESEVEIIWDENKDCIDLKVGSFSFYNNCMRDAIAKQLSTYEKNPQRYFFDSNILDALVDTEVRLSTEGEIIRKALATDVKAFDHSDVRQDITAGYLVSFGLGAGLHLCELVSQYDFKTLIICEGYIDFLQVSMQLIDWEPIVKLIEHRGGRIQFLFDDSPQQLNVHLSFLIQSMHPGRLDGSYIYVHHTFGPLAETINRFNESKNLLIQYNGWLEDELRHVRSITGNIIENGEFPIIDGSLELSPQKPVIIVGSGPTLSQDLIALRSIQEKVLIVSAGSSLRILLHAGIEPDFHCELENARMLPYVLDEVSDGFDLSNIVFLSAYTTPPPCASKFKKVLYFARESEAASQIFSKNVPIIPFSGRTATSSALAIFLFWQSKDIFLLGTDFAEILDGTTHAENAIYNSQRKDGMDYGKGSASEKKTLMVPGNFETEVRSSVLWTFMKQGMELAITYYSQKGNTKIYNLSNGARIEGANPCEMSLLVDACKKLSINNYDNFKIYNSFERTVLKDTVRFDLLEELALDIVHIIQELNDFPMYDGKVLVSKFETFIESFIDENATRNNCRQSKLFLSGSLLQIYHLIRFKLLRAETVCKIDVEKRLIVGCCKYLNLVLVYFLSEVLHISDLLNRKLNLNIDFLESHAELFAWYKFCHSTRYALEDIEEMLKKIELNNSMYRYLLQLLHNIYHDDRISKVSIKDVHMIQAIEESILKKLDIERHQFHWWNS